MQCIWWLTLCSVYPLSCLLSTECSNLILNSGLHVVIYFLHAISADDYYLFLLLIIVFKAAVAMFFSAQTAVFIFKFTLLCCSCFYLFIFIWCNYGIQREASVLEVKLVFSKNLYCQQINWEKDSIVSYNSYSNSFLNRRLYVYSNNDSKR